MVFRECSSVFSFYHFHVRKCGVAQTCGFKISYATAKLLPSNSDIFLCSVDSKNWTWSLKEHNRFGLRIVLNCYRIHLQTNCLFVTRGREGRVRGWRRAIETRSIWKLIFGRPSPRIPLTRSSRIIARGGGNRRMANGLRSPGSFGPQKPRRAAVARTKGRWNRRRRENGW